jgi:hypothetical protein
MASVPSVPIWKGKTKKELTRQEILIFLFYLVSNYIVSSNINDLLIILKMDIDVLVNTEKVPKQ